MASKDVGMTRNYKESSSDPLHGHDTYRKVRLRSILMELEGKFN